MYINTRVAHKSVFRAKLELRQQKLGINAATRRLEQFLDKYDDDHFVHELMCTYYIHDRHLSLINLHNSSGADARV